MTKDFESNLLMVPSIPLLRYKPGDIIFREGDEPQGLFFICAGRVEISTTSPKGKLVFDTLGPRMIFGEMAIIDHRPRSATAMALEDTTCQLLSVAALDKQIEDLPPFMKALFRILTTNIRMMNKSKAAKQMPLPPKKH